MVGKRIDLTDRLLTSPRRSFRIYGLDRVSPDRLFPADAAGSDDCFSLASEHVVINRTGRSYCAVEKFLQKNRGGTVDAGKIAGIFTVLPEAGTPLIRSSFYVHLGLQIGLNFVPTFAKATAGKPAAKEENWEAHLSFFCAQKCVRTLVL